VHTNLNFQAFFSLKKLKGLFEVKIMRPWCSKFITNIHMFLLLAIVFEPCSPRLVAHWSWAWSGDLPGKLGCCWKRC